MAILYARKAPHPDFEYGMVVDTAEDAEPWNPRIWIKAYQPVNLPEIERAVFWEWLESKWQGTPEDPYAVMLAMRKWKIDLSNWGPNDENYVENIDRPAADRIARLMAHKIDV